MTDKSTAQQVIVLAQRGDPDAITTIYQTYAAMIHRYIGYRVESKQDAEDLTSEVFVRMVRDLPRYRSTGAPFEAWLYRIAAARVADFYKGQQRFKHRLLTDDFSSDSPPLEDRLLEAQEKTQLHQAMSQLNEDEQNVLIMRFVERKSHQEVAEFLSKSETAVKSIQHRALIRLAKHLGSEEKVKHYLRGNS